MFVFSAKMLLSAENMNTWNYTSTLLCAFMVYYLTQHKENLLYKNRSSIFQRVPSNDSASNRKEYQEYFLGVKA